MLTTHPKLEGKMIGAEFQTLERHRGHGLFTPSRFKAIVDGNGRELAAVSDRYRLVQNADLVSALDLAADARGVAIEPTRADYWRGRSRYEFRLPDLSFHAPGDPSPTFATVAIQNDYRGSGGIVIRSGLFRLVCSNGAMREVTARRINQRHTGEFDIYKFVLLALDSATDQYHANRVMAETLAARPVLEPAPVVARILEHTAPRYHQRVDAAIARNLADLGPTLWAIHNAITEVGTHEMRNTPAADAWTSRQLDLVESLVAVA